MHRLEDEPTRRHIRRMEAYSKIINCCKFFENPQPKEQQEEVDRLLEEAMGIDHLH